MAATTEALKKKLDTDTTDVSETQDTTVNEVKPLFSVINQGPYVLADPFTGISYRPGEAVAIFKEEPWLQAQIDVKLFAKI